MLNDLRSKGFRWDETSLAAELDLYVGDLVEDGAGELLLPHVC
jgi:hypothetical protein